MGKSPGKWIKTILFGKKYSKSRSSKNVTPDKRISFKASTEDHVGNSPDISATHELMENGAPYVRSENGIPDPPNTNPFGASQGQESEVVSVRLTDEEILRQNQSAAKVQATFRGYLARRAFRALKGIIRLQALIRGHLVRRQAVATLYSMQAIVKLQAAIRRWNAEKRPQKYNAGDLQVMSYQNLATNLCIRKLLRSVPNAMPLTLQYEESEPNSTSTWLERWSHSRFWVPLHPRKASIVISHRKSSADNDVVRSKRTTRRAETAQNGDNAHETDAKRNLKKGTSHQSDMAQKQSQNELGKIKRSLRKAPAPIVTPSEKVETIIEQMEPHSSVKTGAETAMHADETVNPVITENGHETAPSDEASEVLQNGVSSVNADPLENDIELKQEEAEETSVKENQKVRGRRSLPAKPELTESPSRNTPPSLPSYMAATQSAKAKLRASGSPNAMEGVSHIRRYSLPTPANGKMASLSPGVQAPTSKGALKANRSTVSNRDGWKR